MASQLYNGDGIDKNLKESFKWSLKAAEQGDVESQNDVGLSYELGEGVKKDPVQALTWFKRAAENGQIEAQYNTALKYYNGAGVERNLDEALKYAEMAANNGSNSAIKLIYSIYADESSSKYNPEKAKYWESKL